MASTSDSGGQIGLASLSAGPLGFQRSQGSADSARKARAVVHLMASELRFGGMLALAVPRLPLADDNSWGERRLI